MSEKKYCKKCNKYKLISEFKVRKGYNILKSGEKKIYHYYYECNECLKIRLKQLEKKYRYKRKVNRDDGSIGWSIYLRKLRSTKKSKITLNEFKKWEQIQKKECSYCGFKLLEIQKILKQYLPENFMTLSRKFQLDRKDNNLGYTIENICFACAICNTHKRDFFTHKEFKEIAKKFIIPKIKKQLYG